MTALIYLNLFSDLCLILTLSCVLHFYLFILEVVKVTQSCLTLCDSKDQTVHGILQAGILEWVAFPFSRGSSQPRSPTLQVDSLPAEPPGKPKNTGVGSLSLLQRIFLTQQLNRSLLHCRWIFTTALQMDFYQLSYQESLTSAYFRIEIMSSY